MSWHGRVLGRSVRNARGLVVPRMKLVSCPGYGIGAPSVMIVVDKIMHLHEIDYNGRYGTEITLVTGGVIRTTDSPAVVQQKMELAGTWVDGKKVDNG